MIPFAYCRTQNVLGSLLHMEGTNGAAVFSDDNPFYSWTPSANTTTSNTQAKFGSTSMHSTSNGGLTSNQSSDYLFQVAGHDYTWEGWIFSTASSTTQEIFSLNNNAGLYNVVRFNGTTGSISWFTPATTTLAGGSFSLNAWHHVAIVRGGSTFTLYADGTSVGTLTSSAVIAKVATNFTIGFSTTGSAPFAGFIDECRFSPFARYYANFTPAGPLTLQ